MVTLVNVLPGQPLQMCLVQYDHVLEQLSSQRAMVIRDSVPFLDEGYVLLADAPGSRRRVESRGLLPVPA